MAGLIAVLSAPVLAPDRPRASSSRTGVRCSSASVRVGRDGVEFEILKFRTMVVDAEARLAELAAANERTRSAVQDGRTTRGSRASGGSCGPPASTSCRSCSTCSAATMSLVGPRPALPTEVAEFPAELNARHRVRPGITGLWQVEARDNPSFEAYLRLDLFYVENWSLAARPADPARHRSTTSCCARSSSVMYRGEDAASCARRDRRPPTRRRRASTVAATVNVA